ncbi:mCG1048967, partial [Mus musculus]
EIKLCRRRFWSVVFFLAGRENASNNNQKLETTQMFHNRRMDTENVVPYTTEYCSAIKNKYILDFAGKWMEVTQTQKNTYDYPPMF